MRETALKLDSTVELMTVTGVAKNMLNGDIIRPIRSAADVIRSLESVYEQAAAKGISLEEWVHREPDFVLRTAEASVGEWLKYITEASIDGCINTEEGKLYLSRSQTKLLEVRFNEAKRQLEEVKQYVYTGTVDGEKRKEHILRVLYNQGINGNTRALQYLIDRVEGRPAEAQVAQVDYDNAYNIYMIIHSLFSKQLEVLNAGNGILLVCCSRRAGKTHLLVAIMFIECLRKPNTMCIYIGETADLSEQLIDSAANEIIDTCGLRDKKGNRLNWRKFDNGSKILVRGLSNTKDPDLIRGNKAKVIVIDEFYHLKSELLAYMQREVLEPMQLDYADDYKFICAGTPPSIKGTFGEYAWKHWEVPHFNWTWRDNPHPVNLQAREDYINKVLKEKGLDWDSPFARREYNGEWIYDDDLLLYPDFKVYDPREAYPSWHIDQVLLGIDYGVGDNDCIVGIAWDNSAMRGYVWKEVKFNRLDIKDRTISQLQYLRSEVELAWSEALQFFPSLDPKEANKRILWDADDNDQHVTDDLNINCRLKEHPNLRLQIDNAHKTEKVMMFDKISDLLRTGNLLLPVDGKVVHECLSTVLMRGQNGQVIPEVDDKIYHPDLLPAMRYALWNVLRAV